MHVNHAQSIEFTVEEQQWIKDHPIVNFGYEPKWSPYEIYENGEYTGIVGDYVQRIELETGIDMVPIPNMTWEEAIQGLKNGSINMVPSCAITPERKEYLEFTDLYIDDPIVIVTRTDYQHVGGLEDLNGHTVALPKSYYTTELIGSDYPEINISELKGVEDCLEALSFGSADAFVGNLGVISYNINNNGFTNLKIAAPTHYKRNGIAMAFTKDWVILRDICNKVIRSVSFKEKSEIRNKWISVRYEHGIDWVTVMKWSSIVGVFLMILFAQFYYWNKNLRKENKLRSEVENKLRESLLVISKQHDEKGILLQEIHHRIKNNLQIVTSIMNLRSSTIDDQFVKGVLDEAIERVSSIALIHDKIYNSKEVNDVLVKDYFESLVMEIVSNLYHQDIKTTIKSNISSLDMNTLVPLALMLTELLTNSTKYGLKDQKNPELEIDFNLVGGKLELRYFDNGLWVENSESDNFGTSLINTLTKQLNGNYELNKSNKGTEYLFSFDFSLVS
tara:strand:+ start:38 stop:1549 length:1512 start_codon:yes stop_codon:yes gene_type:complete